MSLSINILAKNEENYIADCLNSVHDIADEIIFLDTGSTDRTKEIALSYPKVKLYESTWGYDQSIVRNEAISYSTCDWILPLDADEKLNEKTQKKLLSFLEKNENVNNNTVFCFLTVNMFDFHSKYYFKSTLFKNNNLIKYFRPVHPQLYIENENLNYINCSEMIIEHSERNMKENERIKRAEGYVKKISEVISENKNNDNWYYYKHLGDAYLTLSAYDKAIESYLESNKLYKKVKSVVLNDMLYASNLNKISRILIFNRKQYHEAIKFLEELIITNPETVDGFYHMAICEQYSKNYNKAIYFYKKSYINASKKNNLNDFLKTIENNINYLNSIIYTTDKY